LISYVSVFKLVLSLLTCHLIIDIQLDYFVLFDYVSYFRVTLWDKLE